MEGKEMKKVLFLLLISMVSIALVACSGDEEKETKAEEEPKQEEKKMEEPKEEKPEEESEDIEENKEKEEEPKEQENNIDTSMYQYTQNIEVTDALELNDHITLIINVNEESTPGLAFSHVLEGTFDFLQQDIVKKAKTVGINVVQGEQKIAMFTVRPSEFKPDDNTPMAELVLNASDVEMMLPEVEEYANTMELPVN